MKQVIVVRKDLELSKGKLAAQVAHAAVNASEKVRSRNKKTWKKWMDGGGKKIVLKAESVRDLMEIKELANKNNLATSLIKDAGHTELNPGTITTLGIGPANEKKIDKITGDLETY